MENKIEKPRKWRATHFRRASERQGNVTHLTDATERKVNKKKLKGVQFEHLLWKLPNALNQVLVGCTVRGHELTDGWNHRKGVPETRQLEVNSERSAALS